MAARSLICARRQQLPSRQSLFLIALALDDACLFGILEIKADDESTARNQNGDLRRRPSGFFLKASQGKSARPVIV